MATRQSLLIKLAIAIVLIGVVAGIVWLAPQKSSDQTAAGDWTCSMHPQIRQPRPGRCPICGMDLVPVAELAKEQSAMQQRAGVETEAVAYRELFKEIRTVGKLDYNERSVAYITARIAGRVDRVHADFAGIPVKKGDHLVEIYSPQLYLAQGELIRAREAVREARSKGDITFAESTLEAARIKLRLLGLLPEQLQEIETAGKISTYLTIYAPIGGTVIEKSIRAGQYVKEGDMLYRIADLDPIWIFLDIYEYDLGWVRYGQQANVTLEAYPGERFQGIVTFIDPFLDDKTRTVKVRINLKNNERRLKPGMYASASIRIRLRGDGTPESTGIEGKYICPMHPEVVQDKLGNCPICEMKLEKVPEAKPVRLPASQEHGPECPEHQHPSAKTKDKPSTPASTKVLAVRASAVLDTGRRQVVYREAKPGEYDLVEVQLGPRAETQDDKGQKVGFYPILAGLQAGDLVVIQGGFLIDSQSQIEGKKSLLFPQGQGGVNLHGGHGGSATKPSRDGHNH